MNEKYTIKEALVTDNVHGYTYNLTNARDAQKLYTTLNSYEEKLELYQNVTSQLDKVCESLIKIQLGIIKLQVNVDDLKRRGLK